jgi:outer membrane lipoprotein-sorting protein
MTHRLLSIVLTGCVFLAGCCNCGKQTTASTENRLNPPGLLTMTAVVDAINSNNARIPTLYATLNYSATIRDGNQVHSVSSDEGYVWYRRPDDFRLVGKMAAVGTVFDIGSNSERYWLEVIPGTNRLWFGTYADLARLQSDQLPIPIRPDLVTQVLAVATINPDFNALPAPTMRYDGAADAYVLVFIVHAPDRWLAQKEIWYDRATLRPRRVILYDLDGRPVLRATLSLDKRVRSPEGKPADWPLVPGDYKLFFPDSGSRMEFSLNDVSLEHKVGRVVFPNARTFQMPDVKGTDVRPIQIGGGGGS